MASLCEVAACAEPIREGVGADSRGVFAPLCIDHIIEIVVHGSKQTNGLRLKNGRLLTHGSGGRPTILNEVSDA